MTFGSNVAPRRRIKEKPAEWRCFCPSNYVKPGYLTRCDRCGTERP